MAYYKIKYRLCKTRKTEIKRGFKTLKDAKLAANKLAKEFPVMDAVVIEAKRMGNPDLRTIYKPVCWRDYRTCEGDYALSGWKAA